MAGVFSRRTSWTSSENRIAKAVRSRQAHGLPLLDLTETNPTRVGLGLPEEILREAALDPAALRYEPDPLGRRDAREAVSRYHGTRVPPERIVLSASTSEAYSQLFTLLCDPGDRILVPNPSYPLFEYLAGIASVEVEGYSSFPFDGWHVDLEELEMKVGPKTRAVLVVAPNNPTGAMLHKRELSVIADICRRHELALIADEVFADYTIGLDPHRVPTLAGHAGCLTFVLSGLSKVCLTPQLKVGWTLVSGPRRKASEALSRLEILADTFLSVSTASQLAVPKLLEARATIQAPLRARLEANREQLVRALEGTAADVLRSDGGWSAVVRVPATRSEEDWVLALLKADGVLVHPGFFFDFAREAYLILSLIVEESVFQLAAQRLAEHARA